jgi:hypothetical protein
MMTEHLNGEYAEVAGMAPPAAAARGVTHKQYSAGSASGETDTGKAKPREVDARRLSDVQMRPIEWLWPGRIALGKHTALAGEPGTGKSTLLLWVAAKVSAGGSWPCGEGAVPKGTVLILSAEDGVEDTIKPRVLAAGGDPDKVEVITAMKGADGKFSSFTLQADLMALEARIKKLGDVRLLIVDPLTSYLGSRVDGNSNTDIRHIVEPLHEMAERQKVAILSNGHFSKAGAANRSRASHRFVGSIAFVALPRIAFVVVPDRDNEDRRLMLQVKNNIAPAAEGLAFRLVQRLAGYVGEPPQPLYASCVSWEAEHVILTADQAIAEHEGTLRGEERERQTPQQAEAEEFLRSWLEGGSRSASAKDVERGAKEAGISSKVLRTVRERICISEPIKDNGKITGHAWALKPDAGNPTVG